MCVLTLSMTPKLFLKIQRELEQPISSMFLGLDDYCAMLELLSSALILRRGAFQIFVVLNFGMVFKNILQSHPRKLLFVINPVSIVLFLNARSLNAGLL